MYGFIMCEFYIKGIKDERERDSYGIKIILAIILNQFYFDFKN